MKYKFTKLVFLGVGILSLAPLGTYAIKDAISVSSREAAIPHATSLQATDGATSATGPIASDNVLDNRASDVRNSPMDSRLADRVEATDLVASAFSRIHHANMMEIEMGKLAMQKGQSKAVRDYGERLMRDHQMSDRKLMAFAEDRKIPIDRTLAVTPAEAAASRLMADKLHGALNTEFDRLFLQQMAENHAKTVNDISQSIDQISERRARNFLRKVRPIVGQHEQLANILLQKTS